jgi:hypothetical protein
MKPSSCWFQHGEQKGPGIEGRRGQLSQETTTAEGATTTKALELDRS